jgi:hypothetical protein
MVNKKMLDAPVPLLSFLSCRRPFLHFIMVFSLPSAEYGQHSIHVMNRSTVPTHISTVPCIIQTGGKSRHRQQQ